MKENKILKPIEVSEDLYKKHISLLGNSFTGKTIFIEKAGEPFGKQSSFNVKVDENILKEFKQVVKNNGGKIGSETTKALIGYVNGNLKINELESEISKMRNENNRTYHEYLHITVKRDELHEKCRDLEEELHKLKMENRLLQRDVDCFKSKGQ